MNEQDLIERLRIRAKIRREAKDRLSVKENKPDRLADLLDEAADEIEMLREVKDFCRSMVEKMGD